VSAAAPPPAASAAAAAPPPANGSNARLPTGIKRLDALLGGGLPVGSAALVYGPPFLGKEVLARRFMLACMAGGVPAIDVVTTVATADVRRNLQEADPKYPEYEKARLARFVDTYSRSIGAADSFKDAQYLDGSLDLNGISLAVNKAEADVIGGHDRHALVLNSVSTLIAYSNAQTAFRFLQTLIGRTRRAGATGLFLMDHGMHTDADVQMFKHLMTGTIELREASGKTQVQVQGLGVTTPPGWVDYRFDDHTFEVTGSFAAGRIR
jgi:KaiC/GvpD/RAD55 family RecA-like ATPase